jgi:hypothetical protein
MVADAAQTKTAETRSAAIASLTLAVRNRFAATTARLIGGIASVAREEMTFSRGDSSVVRELTVDSGTTRLGVQLSRPSDPSADIDVHIFDCTGSRCDRHVSAVFLGAEKELLVQNPRPGRWRIVIDPYSVPSGRTSVEYQDEIVHPKFGTAKVLRPVVQLRSNETVPVTVLTRFGVPPGPGRTRELRVEGESLDDQTPSAPAPWGPRYPRGVLGVIRTDLPNR